MSSSAKSSSSARCSPSYFTCTLGEARILNATLEPAPYHTVNEFIDYLAEHYGDTTAVACARPGSDDSWIVEALSFFELEQLSSKLCGHLKSQLDPGLPQQTVACYASSSLSYLVHLLALLRAGYKVALISTACTADAIKHLLNACKATAVLYDDRHGKLIEQLITSSADSSLESVVRINLSHELTEQLNRLNTVKGLPALERTGNADDIVLYGHSSGTSTGLPKPIPITHQDEIGALPRFHQIAEYESPSSTLSTTPIYTGGLADLWRSWSARTTLWTYPENEIPITAENILKYKIAAEEWICNHTKTASPIGYLSCVPYVTQMMAENTSLLAWLKTMKMVGVGGAAMSASLGDMLVEKGVSLVSRFGSRECGFLLSSDRDYDHDKEWQYLRHDESVKDIMFQKWNDTDYELIVTQSWPSLSPAIRDKLPFNSHDVFKPHLTIRNAWKYNGRSDVQITLITGKKFDPAGIEASLVASDLIEDAVVIGNDQLQPAAIIFSSEQAECLNQEERHQKIWNSVSDVNVICPSHARLQQSMIIVLPSTEVSKIQRSSKGSLMRGKFNESFAEIIRRLYTENKEHRSGTKLNNLGDEERMEAISSIVKELLGTKALDANASFYNAGVDSTMSMQIRNQIRARLSDSLMDKIPMNIVYNTGCIKELSDFVAKLGVIHTGIDINDSDIVGGEHEMEQFLEPIRASDEQSRDLLVETSEMRRLFSGESEAGETVLLTGATGFLGAHILAELTNNPKIQRIVCLVRNHSKDRESIEAQDRVLKSLSSYGISLSKAELGKIISLYSTLDKADLGLSTRDLQQILPRLDHIIHAAWAVNFSLPLQAFSNHLRGLLHLYNLAKVVKVSGGRTRFAFVSSTAAILSASKPISETLSLNVSDASGTGYGKSKWAAEKILREICSEAKWPDVTILRVGQLTGNSISGAWNLREAWPLMMDAGFRLLQDDKKALLPDLSNISDKELDWLPVDLAAKSVLEIALAESEGEIKSKLNVFHVVSSLASGPTWADVKNWLGQPVNLNLKCQKKSFEVEFLPPQQWLDLLEEKGHQGHKHLAMSLIPLWRNGWIEDQISILEEQFSTEEAQRHSKTMQAQTVGKGVTKEDFLRMLGWILSQ